jgi:hypothetical protein
VTQAAADRDDDGHERESSEDALHEAFADWWPPAEQ